MRALIESTSADFLRGTPVVDGREASRRYAGARRWDGFGGTFLVFDVILDAKSRLTSPDLELTYKFVAHPAALGEAVVVGPESYGAGVKQVVQVRLEVNASQLDVLARTLIACNETATWCKRSRTPSVCTGPGICGRSRMRKSATIPDSGRRWRNHVSVKSLTRTPH